jgi:hypothetical protein
MHIGVFDDDPSARATFGIDEGDPVQIYIQQIYIHQVYE